MNSDNFDSPNDAGALIDASAQADEGLWEPGLKKPVRKGGLPRWVWYGCGCGCLMIFLLVAVVGVGSYMLFKDAADPEVQWANLREHLHFDQRPEDLNLEYGVRVPDFDLIVTEFPGSEEYSLRDEEQGTIVSVKVISSSEQLALMMDPLGGESPIEVTEGESLSLEVQGREVDAMSFESTSTKLPFMTDEMQERLDAGAGIRIVLPRGEHSLVVELRSGTPGQAVTQEQIDDFFGHFSVWR